MTRIASGAGDALEGVAFGVGLPGESPMVNDARSRSSSLDFRALVSALFFGSDEGPGLVERRWGEVLVTRWAASDLRKFESAGSGSWVEDGDRDVFTSSERLLVSADDSPPGWVDSWTNVSTTWRN